MTLDRVLHGGERLRSRGALLAVASCVALLLSGPASGADDPLHSVQNRVPVTSFDAVPGAPIRLDTLATVRGVPAWADYPGAPPPFALPIGGRATQTAAPKRTDATPVSLYLASGSLYATGVLGADGYDEVSYYDGEGNVVTTISILRAASARASLTENARGRPKPAPKVVRRDRAGRHRETASCAATGAYNDSGYRLYTGTMPFYISTNVNNAWVNAIRYGADNWNAMQNWCGRADQSAISLSYSGRAALGFARDGVNVFDYGPVEAFGGDCNSSSVVGCNQRWPHPTAPPYLAEDDLRLDNGFSWFYNGVPSCGPSCMDVEGVATHEFGHALGGLEHVSLSSEVMWNLIAPDNTSNRKLGSGETSWANAVY